MLLLAHQLCVCVWGGGGGGMVNDLCFFKLPTKRYVINDGFDDITVSEFPLNLYS